MIINAKTLLMSNCGNKLIIKSGNNKKSIKNYIDIIIKTLSINDQIALVGIGSKQIILENNINKTITLLEILKRKIGNLKYRTKLYWENIRVAENSNGKIEKSQAIEIILFSEEITKAIIKDIINNETFFKREIKTKISKEKNLKNLEEILDKFN